MTRSFRRAGGRFTVPAASVASVEVLEHLTPVPTAPAAVRGLVLVRGQVLPVIDVLPGEAQPPARGALLVLVELGERSGRAALVADEVDLDAAEARPLDLVALATAIRDAIDAQGGFPGRASGP